MTPWRPRRKSHNINGRTKMVDDVSWGSMQFAHRVIILPLNASVFARVVNLGHCIQKWIINSLVYFYHGMDRRSSPVVFFVMASRVIFQRLFVVWLFYFKLCIIFICLHRSIKECFRSLQIFSSCSCLHCILEIYSPWFYNNKTITLPSTYAAACLKFRFG